MEEILLCGGIINIDSSCEIQMLNDIAMRHPGLIIKIGIRCNFSINGKSSRFGFDTDLDSFAALLSCLTEKNIRVIGFHCHLKGRDLETWARKTDQMLEFIDQLLDKGLVNEIPQYIDLGGGLAGKIKYKKADKESVAMPSFNDYAEVIARKFKNKYGVTDGPLLILEPGTALVADAMKYVVKVVDIKHIHGKPIATVTGSIFNINSIYRNACPSVTVYHANNAEEPSINYSDLDICGCTCIEDDCIYSGYKGVLGIADYVVCENAGAYSLVFKPPFIFPNCAVIEYNNETMDFELIRRQERYQDILSSYRFHC